MRFSPPLVAGLALLAALPVRADKMDKDAKAWLDQVRPIMLPEEEKLYRELADKSDRGEFQKIFWARRDPNLDTPENEYQAEYEKTRAAADAKYHANTDCARMAILLGEPAEVKKDGDGQTWTYKGEHFKGGQIQVRFESTCMLPAGADPRQLDPVAAERIVHPNLTYTKSHEGHLIRLADQLPKPSAAQTLIKTPRQDFPLDTQTVMTLRSPSGGATYIGGIVRGPATSMGAAKTAQVVMQVVDKSGGVTAVPERNTTVEVVGDNFVTSYGMALKPGDYTLRVGVLDPASGKGSVKETPLVVPDLASSTEFQTSPPIVGMIEEGKKADPNDAMSALFLGSNRIVAKWGNVFTPADSLDVLTFYYHAAVDPATGKASVAADYSILKDGTPKAKADQQVFDTVDGVAPLGPVPMSGMAPGKYVLRVKLHDNVGKKDAATDVPFEVAAH